MTNPMIPASGFLSAIAPLIKETGGRQPVDDNGYFIGPDYPLNVILTCCARCGAALNDVNCDTADNHECKQEPSQ